MKYPQVCLFLPSNLNYFLSKHRVSLLDIFKIHASRLDSKGKILLNMDLSKLPVTGYDREVLMMQIYHCHMLLHLKIDYKIVLSDTDLVDKNDRMLFNYSESTENNGVAVLSDLDTSLMEISCSVPYQIDTIGDFIVTWTGRGIWSHMSQAENKIAYLKTLCDKIIAHRNQVSDVSSTILFNTLLRLVQAKSSLYVSPVHP